MIFDARSAVLGPISELFDRGTLTGLSDDQLVERFVARRDEKAFEALVIRHGRAVLAVCHDVLRDGHDAEDAFQATFLILARKARSLWVRGSLAAWLHRVARRVSVEANGRKARRRRFEKTGLEIDTAEVETGSPSKILLGILHEEIDRLPEKYRAPIVLCDLEAVTRDEAARRLGWQPGTVAGRLARARAILRDRISRRTNVETGGLATLVAAGRELPCSLVRRTVHLTMLSSASTMTKSGLGSVGGVELACRVAKAMLTLKPAIHVRGVVRELGTEKPIAGVRIAAALAETGAMTSAQDGSYEGYAPPGGIMMTARYIPLGYVRPLYTPRQIRIPEDAVEFAIPPFELTPAGEVSGLVVDEHSRPAAGAEVKASWKMDVGQFRNQPHDPFGPNRPGRTVRCSGNTPGRRS